MMAAETDRDPMAPGAGALHWSRFGRGAAPALAVGVYIALGAAAEIPDHARTTAAVGALMAVLWMTEALPLSATSLLPVVLFPLTRVMPFGQAAAPYASEYIFLFLGGFMIAQAIERWGLHRRIALVIVSAVGTQPARLIGGFMLATAFLSMWISNTATAVMMLPIALSVTGLFDPQEQRAGSTPPPAADNFSVCLLLGIAYAASIGGVGTLIGTPPNAMLAGFLEQRDIRIGFAEWMAMGVPFGAVLLVLTWLLLTRILYPVGSESVARVSDEIAWQRKHLGPISRGEWNVLCVFVVTAVLWIVRTPLANWKWLVERVPAVAELNDAMIALSGALVLFAIPVDRKQGQFTLDWTTARTLPWGVLLLFGGGLSLAEAAADSGLTDWIGSSVSGLAGAPTILLVFAISLLVIFLTELTSNTATAAAFLPIGMGIASGLGIDPMLLLVPSTLAASCAFMLPVATPPNAIVFSSRRVTIAQMVKAGFWLNLAVVALIPVLMYTIGIRH